MARYRVNLGGAPAASEVDIVDIDFDSWAPLDILALGNGTPFTVDNIDYIATNTNRAEAIESDGTGLHVQPNDTSLESPFNFGPGISFAPTDLFLDFSVEDKFIVQLYLTHTGTQLSDCGGLWLKQGGVETNAYTFIGSRAQDNDPYSSDAPGLRVAPIQSTGGSPLSDVFATNVPLEYEPEYIEFSLLGLNGSIIVRQLETWPGDFPTPETSTFAYQAATKWSPGGANNTYGTDARIQLGGFTNGTETAIFTFHKMRIIRIRANTL